MLLFNPFAFVFLYSPQIGIGSKAVAENYQDFSTSSIFLHASSREDKCKIRIQMAPHQNSVPFSDNFFNLRGRRLNFFPFTAGGFLKMPLLCLYLGRIFSVNIEFSVARCSLYPPCKTLKVFHYLLVSLIRIQQ